MVKFGVGVSIIEPGNYGHATSIAAKVAVFVNSRHTQYIEIFRLNFCNTITKHNTNIGTMHMFQKFQGITIS